MIKHLFPLSLLRILLLLILVISFSLSFPSIARAEITTINVEIEKNKANGKHWDALKGAPDLAICVTHSLAGLLCLPEGDRIETIITAECPNSFKCRFSSEIPDDSFKIYVVDVDAAMNDLIGSGHCAKGKTCEVGQATVSISEKKGWW